MLLGTSLLAAFLSLRSGGGGMMYRRRFPLASAVLLALAVSANALSAQPHSKKFHLGVRAGVYAPLSDLFGFSYDKYRGAQRTLRKGAYLSLGLGAEVSLPLQALSLRASIEYVPKIDVMRSACDPSGPCLAVLLDDVEAQVLVGTADLVIRPATLSPALVPYLLTGVGIKHYSDGLSYTGLTMHFGIGAELVLAEQIGVTLEVGDYLSWFNGFDEGEDSQTQHDLSATLGVRYGWF